MCGWALESKKSKSWSFDSSHEKVDMTDKNKSKFRNTFITPSAIKNKSTKYRATFFCFDNMVRIYES